MKTVHYPAPVDIVDVTGKPVGVDQGQPPQKWHFLMFARLLLTFPVFVDETKDNVSNLELVRDTKLLLDNAGESADPTKGGELSITDEQHAGFQRALKEWTPEYVWSWCLLPFVYALRDAQEAVPAPADPQPAAPVA